MVNESYNGWSNYETWNVALWLENDFRFYSVAVSCKHYRDFLWCCIGGIVPRSTPDGVYFDDRRINHEQLDEMLLELSS